MEPQVTKHAEAQDEQEWELADEELDRPVGIPRYCGSSTING